MASRSEQFKTPALVRAAFVDGLFEVVTDDRGSKSWTCSLLIPKSDSLAAYEKAAVEAAAAEWGGNEKAIKMIKDKIIHSPFLDGDGPQGKSKKTGEPHAGFPGHWFLRVKSGEAYRPTLIDRKKLPITSRDQLYSGCYGYAVLHCFTWENKEKGKGLTFGLDMFQVAKDGDRLGGGGGVDVDKWAEEIPDEGAAPDSTKSGAGAGGLFG
ncbi:ssDNA-binding protein [Bradyrhizobium sp. 33ap4]|uniref:ssDNA-binding protein n=1 Tax=Bradyrhizobium sp. 33ap4 TaxID=3061630 RepID=UPI00292FE7FF|nr:ssDNA-binding protein [Bradyrhizobium sp. 33ap4]